jgi:Icc-related predicted phosphoesterase
MMRDNWSLTEVQQLIDSKNEGKSDAEIAQKMGRPFASVNSKVTRLRQDGKLPKPSKVPPSAYPKLTEAPKLEGDWVIFPDLEAPFHHSEFVNRVIDLAHTWGINKGILAGDFLHLQSLSKWGAAWETNAPSDKQDKLLEFMARLEGDEKDEGMELLEEIGIIGEPDTFSNEIGNAKAVAKAMSDFDKVVYVMGNHDERLVRTLQKGLSTSTLGDLLRTDEKWQISPYYFCTVDTPQGQFRITHPRGAGQNEARNMVNQFHCHVMAAHSHRWSATRDQSSKYWAIHMGHCVDEERLAYVQQRDAKRDTHALGAVILRDGYPHLLSEWTPWEQYKRM